jgi:hypothetical protein
LVPFLLPKGHPRCLQLNEQMMVLGLYGVVSCCSQKEIRDIGNARDVFDFFIRD